MQFSVRLGLFISIRIPIFHIIFLWLRNRDRNTSTNLRLYHNLFSLMIHHGWRYHSIAILNMGSLVHHMIRQTPSRTTGWPSIQPIVLIHNPIFNLIIGQVVAWAIADGSLDRSLDPLIGFSSISQNYSPQLSLLNSHVLNDLEQLVDSSIHPGVQILHISLYLLHLSP